MYTCGVMARFHLPLRRKQNVMALGSNCWGGNSKGTQDQEPGCGGGGGEREGDSRAGRTRS